MLLKVIKPYTRISIGFIAREINISPPEVEQLLVTLILDGMIDGSIDQLSQQLLLNQSSADKAKYQAAEKWATQLQTLQQAVLTMRRRAPQGSAPGVPVALTVVHNKIGGRSASCWACFRGSD